MAALGATAKAGNVLLHILGLVWQGIVWYATAGLTRVWVAMATTSVVTAALLWWFPQYGHDVVLALSGFYVSGLVYGLFIGGGRGIAQVPATGTYARTHGHAFLAIWGGILFSGLLGSLVGAWVYDAFVAPHVLSFGTDFVVGIAFSGLVAFDLKLTWLAR